jgi:hypothetical protein
MIAYFKLDLRGVRFGVRAPALQAVLVYALCRGCYHGHELEAVSAPAYTDSRPLATVQDDLQEPQWQSATNPRRQHTAARSV